MSIKPRFLDPWTLLLFAVLAVLSAGMVYAGRDFQGLDLKLYYTAKEAFETLDALTESQRRTYRLIEYWDFFYISIYTSLLVWNLQKVSGRKWAWWGMMPAFWDSIENVGILCWLQMPANHGYFQHLGGVTLFKWLSGLGLSFFILFRFSGFRNSSQ